jgi:hypothetical protein
LDPSLRAKRSNPVDESRIPGCFGAFGRLAMMGWTAPDGISVPDW